METTNRRAFNTSGQGGFTLIEIIAVLVILGMLAAVAVPKYLSLQQGSAQQAVMGVLAAGTSQITLEYSAALLAGQTPAAAVATAIANCTANNAVMNDFNLSWTASGANGVTVAVTGGATAAGLSVFQNLAAGATTTKLITFF